MSPALARPAQSAVLDLDAFSRATGLHPVLVERLVALGLLQTVPTVGGPVQFSAAEVVRASRIQRLRDGLALNYAALGLVLDLLDRIDVLESRLRRNGGPNRQWT
ncbi:MAG: MerR family transcriptional regulator [Acidimicrobiales bacterium]|jgi:chaperone modulatory protein CbpM|nr:MerR family transcriptional regulator [Acidimicrobiales bacterium]